jgi:hypothetical protein
MIILVILSLWLAGEGVSSVNSSVSQQIVDVAAASVLSMVRSSTVSVLFLCLAGEGVSSVNAAVYFTSQQIVDIAAASVLSMVRSSTVYVLFSLVNLLTDHIALIVLISRAGILAAMVTLYIFAAFLFRERGCTEEEEEAVCHRAAEKKKRRRRPPLEAPAAPVIRPAPRHFILRGERKQEADSKPLPRPQSKHCSTKLSLAPVIALKPESPKFVPKLSLAPVIALKPESPKSVPAPRPPVQVQWGPNCTLEFTVYDHEVKEKKACYRAIAERLYFHSAVVDDFVNGRVDDLLDERRETNAALIQSLWRGFSTRLILGECRVAATVIQSTWKTFRRNRERDVLEAAKEVSVLSIQSVWRGFSTRLILGECRVAATVIQSTWKTFRRNRERDVLEAAKEVLVLSIQSVWRGFSTRLTLGECRVAATVIQATFRGNCSRTTQPLILSDPQVFDVESTDEEDQVAAGDATLIDEDVRVEVPVLAQGTVPQPLVEDEVEEEGEEALPPRRSARIAALAAAAVAEANGCRQPRLRRIPRVSYKGMC